MNLYFDLETMPTNDPAIIAEFAASITAPGQYKKQESIDAWLLENRAEAVTEKVSKTSFDGLYGSIACIAWAVDDGDIQSTLSSDSECMAIDKFYDAIRAQANEQGNITFVGHNVAGFDLPFLKHRSIINQIKPPPDIRAAMNAKPWDSCIADTMLMWSSDPHKRGSMDRLCKAFGIAGKGDFDGSMVAETWPVDPDKVIQYCKDDIQRTRAMYKRIMFL